MNGQTARKIDDLFDAFLAAGDQPACDRRLAELMTDGVEPLVKSLIRNQLRVSLRPDDERQINQDALDMVGDIEALIVAKLNGFKLNSGLGKIENLEAYVKTVAKNASNHYLRRKHPNRLRLKNQLRYMLTRDRRFALWTGEDDNWICGLREWQEWQASSNDEDPSETLKLVFAEEDISPDKIELVELVRLIFEHVGTAIRFGDLIGLVYKVRRISEPVEVPADDTGRENSLEYKNNVLDRMEQTAFLKSLWEEIGGLPLRHRAALLLNLKSSRGDGLMTLLPFIRVASIRQIAEMLEFPIEEFVKIWNELPWDDNAIAGHLGLTRQQVINLRQSARATLRRKLNYF